MFPLIVQTSKFSIRSRPTDLIQPVHAIFLSSVICDVWFQYWQWRMISVFTSAGPHAYFWRQLLERLYDGAWR